MMRSSYRPLVLQTIHYFSRPHESVRRAPLAGAAAWRGRDLGDASNWRITLSEGEVAEIERAVAAAERSQKPLAKLTAADFPLPTLSRRIDEWRETIASGRGFIVLRGVPTARWSQQTAELFFWCFGLHLGVPGAQNPQGDLLGHVRDTGEEPGKVRAYRTATNINYHCDAADAVGLLCLRPAQRGGVSRIVSSVTVYNELLQKRPELVERLYEPLPFDTHGEGGVDFVPIAPCRHYRGRLRTFYHSDYFRSVYDNTSLSIVQRDRELLDAYDEIAADPALYLEMDLAAGDIQLVSNHTILHARTAYEDDDAAHGSRHLLRLWLSFEPDLPLRERLSKERSRLSFVGWLARRRLINAISR